MFKPRLIYVFDALCGWCYGFSPVIMAVFENFSDRLVPEVISGGLILGNRVGPVGVVGSFIETAYKTVEETTGITFGEPFLKNVERGELILDSEKPAIGLAVLRSYDPAKVLQFAHEIQNAIKFDGKNPNEDELYRYIAVNHGYDPDEVSHKLKEEDYKQMAYYDFALAKQLKITSYPAALVQTDELKFFLVARGFTDYDTLNRRIDNVLLEVGYA